MDHFVCIGYYFDLPHIAYRPADSRFSITASIFDRLLRMYGLSKTFGKTMRTCLPCHDWEWQGERARRGQLTSDEVEGIGQSLLACLHHAHDS